VAAPQGETLMGADALSDLLKTVRLTGAVFFEIHAGDDWAVGSPAPNMILPKILPMRITLWPFTS